MSHFKTQFADSLTSDFSENTWTFQMDFEDFTVTAGEFAIISKKQYQKLLTAIHGMRNSMNAHPDCNSDSEFSDMVSRVDEILEQL